MRLDYPAFLGGTFRNLEWYGAHLRKEHGMGTRRNIRFDEENLSLYMDVLLPGAEQKWLRVSPQMAEEAKRENQQNNDMATKWLLRAPRQRRLGSSISGPSGSRSGTPATGLGQGRAAGSRRGNADANKNQGQQEDKMDFDPNFEGFPDQSFRSPVKR